MLLIETDVTMTPELIRSLNHSEIEQRIKYAIRLPANQVLQSRIGYLLKRPVGRPPNEVRRFHANFSYQAGS
jgi:hypothetical protein